MIYRAGFAVTGQIIGACMVTVYHTAAQLPIEGASVWLDLPSF